MAVLKNVFMNEEKVLKCKANGRVEQRQMRIDGKQMTVKIYSLRNKEFGAFEYIVPARAGVAVKPNMKVVLINPRLHSVGRVNSSQYVDGTGRQATDYIAFVERSIIGDGLEIKEGK